MAPATALLGDSVAMRALRRCIECVGPSPAPTLITGPTGSGKERVARALHESSPRGRGPFVVVDCAALAASVLESELFGHAAGAFTGATIARVGAFEAADGGTVFLDEIGELPRELQPKLLRVMESQQIRRLGTTDYRGIDVRFLGATHRDLRAMVTAGTFREDLYFRLAALHVPVPSLDARRDDIPTLAAHFHGAPLPAWIATELQARAWPGNVRELRNAIEHLKVFGELPGPAEGARPTPVTVVETAAGLTVPRSALEGPLATAREVVAEAFERAYVRSLHARHGGDPTAMAAHAGVDKSLVYRLLRRYDLAGRKGKRG